MTRTSQEQNEKLHEEVKALRAPPTGLWATVASAGSNPDSQLNHCWLGRWWLRSEIVETAVDIFAALSNLASSFSFSPQQTNFFPFHQPSFSSTISFAGPITSQSTTVKSLRLCYRVFHGRRIEHGRITQFHFKR